MRTKDIIVTMLLLALLLLAACKSQPQKYMLPQEEVQKEEAEQESGIANPASVFCINQSGNSWTVKEDEEGNQYGICSFPDASWCDEWDYYQGHCSPGYNYTKCEGQFWGKTVCPSLYQPVCGRIEVGTAAPYEVQYHTFPNSCVACISSTKMEVVVGYTHRRCPQ
jgi:putative hemolysin